MAFIDAHRERFGVEPICRVLTEHGCKIAPNTYWAAKNRPPSARAVRDEQLRVEIARVYDENLFVYGADKIWTQLNAEGIRVARCTVERLMRSMGLSGARRGKTWTATTDSDHELRPARRSRRPGLRSAGPEPALGRRHHLREDLLGLGLRRVRDRRVLPDGRRLAGLEVASHRDLALDALEMAVWNRRRTGVDLTGLVHHSDRGVQYLSIRYADRLAADDIVASVGSKGDSYDNALAESFNGLYKWELIYRQGPWRGIDDVEFATMTYIDWFNHRRLHGTITPAAGYTTPAAHEAAYYRQTTPAPEPVTQ